MPVTAVYFETPVSIARLRGLEDERRRLEVGLADAEREDVDALGAELAALAFIARVTLGTTTDRRCASP